MMRAAILAAFAVALSASPVAAGGCDYYCRKNGGTAASTPAPGERRAITNPSRQRLGDLYSPGGGRRTQIRDNSRRIIGYVERDGTITNTHRQRVRTIKGSQ